MAIDELTGDNTVAAVLNTAATITGAPALDTRRLGRGRNNVTLLLETADGPFVAKHYPATPGDERDRFRTETEALGFMQANGFDCVARLIGTDSAARVAIMDGRGHPAAIEAGNADIDACLDFAAKLHEARSADGAYRLGAASEACPAPADVAWQVRTRRQRLANPADAHTGLDLFLRERFDPALDIFEARARDALGAAGVEFDARLTPDIQTLNPSDFGLHNAVRRDDGRLVFVDFEYFGWDDPVRLVSDFVLHPGHRLGAAQKRRFVGAAAAIYGAADAHFHDRLLALFPLVGLRWCMIVLNEFLPERMARRRAAGEAGATEELLARQLEKADRLLSGLDDSERLLNDR